MKILSVTTVAGAFGVFGLVALGQAMTAQAAAPIEVAQAGADAAELAALMVDGATLFRTNCSSCHGREGQGDFGPALAANEFVARDTAVINQILEGAESHGMPPFRGRLTAHEIAAIVTFVRNSWGNSYGVTTDAMVQPYLGAGG